MYSVIRLSFVRLMLVYLVSINQKQLIFSSKDWLTVKVIKKFQNLYTDLSTKFLSCYAGNYSFGHGFEYVEYVSYRKTVAWIEAHLEYRHAFDINTFHGRMRRICTSIRRATIRKGVVSRHHGSSIKGYPETSSILHQYYTEGFKECPKLSLQYAEMSEIEKIPVRHRGYLRIFGSGRRHLGQTGKTSPRDVQLPERLASLGIMGA